MQYKFNEIGNNIGHRLFSLLFWLAALARRRMCKLLVKSAGAKINLDTDVRHRCSDFADPSSAAEGFIRQARFRYRSDSDGRGIGSAGAAQPGRSITPRFPASRALRARAERPLEGYMLYIGETPACAGEAAGNPGGERPRRQKDRRRKFWHSAGLRGSGALREIRFRREHYHRPVEFDVHRIVMMGPTGAPSMPPWMSRGVRLARPEYLGLKRLLQMASILPIPQAWFRPAATEQETARRLDGGAG